MRDVEAPVGRCEITVAEWRKITAYSKARICEFQAASNRAEVESAQLGLELELAG